MRASLAAALLLICVSARAGTVVSATVNKETVALDDQVELTVTVSGNSASLPSPRLPSLPNFNVYSAGSRQQIAFVNGAFSSSVSHTYTLVPRFAGKAVIGSIVVGEGSDAVSTEPINIAVVRPSAGASAQANPAPAPAPRPSSPTGTPSAPAERTGPDLFVTSEVDNPRPYVNQQVIYTVRFHTAVSLLGNPEWTQPSFSGLLSEDLPPPPHGQAVTIHGRPYFVSEVKIALFPAQPGKLTIGPGSIRCRVQEEVAVDPFAPDFFQRLFATGQMAPQIKELKTRPVELDVQALPASGKPPAFTGAVGRLQIRAAVDRRESKVGEAVNLTVTVDGSGNLKALGDLALPELKGLRAYDTVGSLNLVKDGRGVRGSKTFKTVLVPTVSGSLRVPPISMPFFDPETREYSVASTEPIDIQAQPGEASAPAPSYVAPGGKAVAITPVGEDIRYIHSALAEPALDRAADMLSGLGWLHLLPLLALGACAAAAAHREKLSANPAAARFRGALPKALAKVREARSAMEAEPRRAASLLAEALAVFLAAKLDCPSAGLTRREAEALLRSRFPRLPEGHLSRMRTLWDELEVLRFAPAGQHGPDGQLADGLSELFSVLEEDLK